MVQQVAPAAPQAPASMPPAPLEAVPSASSPSSDEIDFAIVKSPIVGTFFRSAEPGAPAFVDVGATVKKGDVLCIIEAMKLMNEIDSEYDGEIVKVYVENGQPVQYGERLFAIKPNV
jgi:acetyl-CoA carboxylase biotin carboxyl carrier protein